VSPLRPFVKRDDSPPERELIQGEPVVIQIKKDHPYVKGSRGCKKCHGAKYAPQHLGHSESVNAIIGGSHFVYQNMLKGWKEALTIALEETVLPKPCKMILAEGVMCFPQNYNKGPDQGNHRFIVEKALGDALESGGWLENDKWTMYQFGNLDYEMIPGESWTKIILFPR
jgi:hypothetical protein